MERRVAALFSALGALAIGHFAAMAIVLLPFAILTMLAHLSREIQIAAALLVIVFGLFLLIRRRHPRALARIRPTQLALWSFAIAIAHGAGLMLVIGLSTEAVIFFFSAFEPPHEDVDWSLVYPELAGMHDEDASSRKKEKNEHTAD